ncbi:pre-toxin TG domain-containing protein [Microbacterium sp. 179-I 3D2 NHS]|uniref:pre-toxin TG domain-containing protein n=1 Tax=Microbacterium sp. 179-I 3D2 NHS TaxID=3235178 RepID=UPI0039A0FCE3
MNALRRMHASAEDTLVRKLTSATEDAFAIALARRTVETMAWDLRQDPNLDKLWEMRGRKLGLPSDVAWAQDCQKRASQQLAGAEVTADQRLAKILEINAKLPGILAGIAPSAHTTGGGCGERYFLEPKLEERPVPPGFSGPPAPPTALGAQLRAQFLAALDDWTRLHAKDPAFYRKSVSEIVLDLLEERQDIVLAIAVARDFGLTVRKYEPDVQADTVTEAAVFSVECLPYIGNALTLIQAWTGRDLLCRKLSDVERVLAAATVLVPGAFRIIKAGKAAYTAARLSSMYGRGSWSQFLLLAERLSIANSPKVGAVLREAGLVARAEGKIAAPLTKEVGVAMRTLTDRKIAPAVTSAAESKVFAALKGVLSARPAIKELDEFSLKRVADAARTKSSTNVRMGAGQLLEEFKEVRTVKLLGDLHGAAALGLPDRTTRLRYFAGHSLTDSRGAKLTDGMIAGLIPTGQVKREWYGSRSADVIRRIEGVLDIAAIDEAKAGRASARDLRYIREATEADLAHLENVVAARWERATATAKATGKPAPTIEQIRAQVKGEYKLGEVGGQAAKDIERLDQFEDGSLPSIFVGGIEYLARIRGRSKVKIFGVFPKDVKTEGMVRALRKPVAEGGVGLDFEALGVNVTTAELDDLTKEAIKAVGGP